jgi:hypothetical protein
LKRVSITELNKDIPSAAVKRLNAQVLYITKEYLYVEFAEHRRASVQADSVLAIFWTPNPASLPTQPESRDPNSEHRKNGETPEAAASASRPK